MKTETMNLPRLAFWSICLVAICWAAFTIIFEARLGLPVTREQWGHRAIGWFIEAFLIRVFYRGVQRYYKAGGK